MTIGRIAGAVALTGVVWLAGATSALAVTQTQTDEITQDGDTLVYDFTALPPLIGGTGILRLSTTTGGAFPGLDLDNNLESFDVDFDGNDLGTFTCIATSEDATIIPGTTGAQDCQFSFDIAISASILSGAVADGEVRLELAMSPVVTFFGPGDGIDATLIYNVRSTVIPVPAPLALLLTGLAGLAVAGRRA